MFHLVFVMNPPVIESNYRVDEMFHYVISRLSLVLRYEQQKHDYVSQQVKNILALRELLEGNESLLTEKSSLSRVIRDCFEGISTSTIANLSINGKLRSFQIPIKTEFHSLPDPFLSPSFIFVVYSGATWRHKLYQRRRNIQIRPCVQFSTRRGKLGRKDYCLFRPTIIGRPRINHQRYED